MKKIHKYMGACLIFCVLGALLLAYKERSIKLYEIDREGERSKTVIVQVDGQDYPVTLPLTKPKRTQKEAMDLLAKTEHLIIKEQCFLGKNKTATAVTSNLQFEETYMKGQVQCTWSSSPSGYVSEDGSIQQLRLWSEDLEEQKVDLTIRLTCDSVEKMICESIVIRKVVAQSEEEMATFVNSWIKNRQLEAPSNSQIKLPDEIQGKKVQWKSANNRNAWVLILLGIIACIGLVLSDQRTRTRKNQKIKEQYQAHFPGFVQELSVLLSAGMSVRGCFSLIGETMCKQQKQYFLGVQILEMVQSIQKGENEIRVYQNFSQKVDIMEYRRLMSLIIQNICKGTYQMSERLGQIAQESYVEQLRQVKIRGEKVSTKLLLPMGLLLVMILLVVIVPALFMKI